MSMTPDFIFMIQHMDGEKAPQLLPLFYTSFDMAQGDVDWLNRVGIGDFWVTEIPRAHGDY